MVYRTVSKDMKERALWLIDHDYIPADVCEVFHISERSLRRWKSNHNIYGSVFSPTDPLLNPDDT
ncbi:hypothetical protein SERLA73DRAFT_164943 [Serpula lacrymans var. lacrymans S7.3]|uniref:HTH psq-type domain-containing protein n=1 Tax=Serpula lacrymans var. lacrymans (strain S7.3) TaxID=936435 RepID=F8PGG2_SERL3|nr:hypothetical protein SERLA73DRAFT_164943 [Serpula lacrymans var. lacrymans S7.3]